jgi:hypothetical protein
MDGVIDLNTDLASTIAAMQLRWYGSCFMLTSYGMKTRYTMSIFNHSWPGPIEVEPEFGRPSELMA